MAMMAVSCQSSGRPSTCPLWLQAALEDIEQRVHTLALTLPEDPTSDSFAERAENYYEKRPQLLSLVQDLHNRYLHLADRYSQSLLKLTTHHSSSSSAAAAAHTELSDDDDRPPLSTISTFSDADSSYSLSFHPDLSFSCSFSASVNPIIVELTMSLVERNILVEELSSSDRRQCDSLRKIELQKSLLELMESERIVLVTQNARLGYRAAAAEEEGRGLVAEVAYTRMKAAELAKCVGRMREEHRVCVLGRGIEGLQRQVAGLEKREREWREAVARRDRERGEVREEVERLREENRRLRRREKRGAWVWGWEWVGGCAGGGGGAGAQGKTGSSKAGGRGGGCLWESPCFCL